MKSTSEPRRGAGGRVAGGGAGLPFGRLADHLAWFALALIASAYLATLAERVSGARFQTDECFHASMAQWIASHGTLPRVIHELYSGFYYYYPPLFHIAGGLWILAFGAHAFCFLNLFFTAALLVSILAGCR